MNELEGQLLEKYKLNQAYLPETFKYLLANTKNDDYTEVLKVISIYIDLQKDFFPGGSLHEPAMSELDLDMQEAEYLKRQNESFGLTFTLPKYLEPGPWPIMSRPREYDPGHIEGCADNYGEACCPSCDSVVVCDESEFSIGDSCHLCKNKIVGVYLIHASKGKGKQ